ncbi:hypothetical protein [Streptomyces calidiresistens]|uniref:Uncharacterized protein n=1 Tax=Streptomyces calidiresistens TaxID=1485586 RepID=A0A7W3T5U1_9ACTN|nr:hypothetical protein [Streptomyces calidiresistens]MBB0231464.1 hypothetical protein [Streptomyces calidiresistens]
MNGVDRTGALPPGVRVEVEHRGPGPPDGEIAVVRLLARLPASWRYAHRVAPARVELWIEGPDATPGRVRDAVAAALDDPALAAWHGPASDGSPGAGGPGPEG